MPAYQSGFGNEFATEALPGTLPEGRNSPQRAPHGLYAEQLTARRSPRRGTEPAQLAVPHSPGRACTAPFEMLFDGGFHNRFDELPATPNQLRWSPLPPPSAPTDFIDGLFAMAGNGGAASQQRHRHPSVRRQRLDAAAATSTTPTPRC